MINKQQKKRSKAPGGDSSRGQNLRLAFLLLPAVLAVSVLWTTPAWAASHIRQIDVKCGAGLKLQRASVSGSMHTYVFRGECALMTDYDTGPWVEGHPPISATARWDQASATYTETLHLLAPLKGITVVPVRGSGLNFGVSHNVGTGPEKASFKCSADPVIYPSAHCTLIRQHNATGWGGQGDGFAWQAIHNIPLLRGRATAMQAASLSRQKTARINCRNLHLADATGVPNGKNRIYRFEGTCRLYHTKSGSQGLQVTQVLVSGVWEGQQAKENVMVLTDSMKGGGAWSTYYTCNEDPWLNRKAQCSKTARLGGRGKPAPVYDPITDLMDRHPIALGMAKASQAKKLSRLSKARDAAQAAKKAAQAAKLAQLERPRRTFNLKDMAKGMVLSRSSHVTSRPKPKLTIRFALASPAKTCDPNRLLKVNVVIRNEGGPLFAHTRFAYVHAIESGGAHLVGPKVSLPAISSRKTWEGVLVVGTRKSFFPKLPGWHTLVVSIGPDHAAPGTLPYIPTPSFRAKVHVPPGYCQPRNTGVLMRGAAMGAIHATTRGKPTAGLRHGMQQRGVRKKLTPVTPVRRLNLQKKLAPSAIHLKKKLSPSVAHPKIKLSPPTMRLMQLRLNR